MIEAARKPYHVITRCRLCGNPDLTEALDLGAQYIASSFVPSNDGRELATMQIPLTCVLCNRRRNPQACGLLQLRESVERDLLYRDYFYRSGTTATMREGLRELAQEICAATSLKPGDWVLDIGCNDATMLTYFPETARRIGIDPAQNIDRTQLDPAITVVCGYFSKAPILEATGGALCRAVTTVAMFYDLDDPHAFVSDVKAILAPDGVWCIQLSYLPTTLDTLNFYDVCHEHLSYYTVTVLKRLLEAHDLSIIDASLNEANGGSVRVFVTHAGRRAAVPTARLQELYEREAALQMFSVETYQAFARKIAALKSTITEYLRRERAQGRLVIGLGASTKGNVLLQYFGIGKETVPYLSERNPQKVGLRTLGTDIELISEAQACALRPGCMLVLIWFFKEEIIARERDYLAGGGTLLFPMPYPHVVTREGETRLP